MGQVAKVLNDRLIETSYTLPNGNCKIYLKTLVSQKRFRFY